jgi:phosphoribosylamine---glycine ligase
MKVGIIGSGGREHAISHAIQKSHKVDQIFCIPGNAGTSTIAENVDLDFNDFNLLKDFINKKRIDIVIIGPEKPLVDGIVDFLEKEGIKVFGPNKFASKLEGSKIFTKDICKKHNIPTANFGVFENLKTSKNFLEKCNLPIVVKADGLAAGKGVYICETKNQSIQAVEEIFDGKFGTAKQVLIEEFLDGEEMSFFIISDGKNYKKFGTAQDHKRVNEGDKGPNTGGMGAYSPSRLESKILDKKILKKIIEPTLKALKENNSNFKGFLYAGLMIVKNEPYLIEYNVRMGDPECQTILPRLETNFFEIVDAVVNEKIKALNINWYNNKTLSIVLCSKGYPGKFENGNEIKNLKNVKLKKNEFIFHAGTKISKSKIFSNGGRVLNFVVKSESFEECRFQAIDLIKKINWNQGFFRKDIGYKVIDQ